MISHFVIAFNSWNDRYPVEKSRVCVLFGIGQLLYQSLVSKFVTKLLSNLRCPIPVDSFRTLAVELVDHLLAHFIGQLLHLQLKTEECGTLRLW